MRKLFKKFLKLAFYSFSFFLIVVSIILIISQTEKFRLFLHDKVEAELRKTLGEEIYLGKFYGNIFTGFGVDGFYVGFEGKTFVKALSVELKYNPMGLIKGGYSFREIILYKPEVYLIRGKDGKWNFERILKPREKREETKFFFSCDRLVIDDGKFVLVDSLSRGKSKLADSLNCIDYHNFVVHDINAVFSGSYSSDRINLRKIKLSFVVDDDKFNAQIDGKIYADKHKVEVDDFEIITGGSKVKFNFSAETRDNIFRLNRDNVEGVYMNVSLFADSFSFGELTRFIPHVYFLSGSPMIKVEAEGTLKDLKVRRIEAKVYNSDIYVSGELKNILRFSDFLIDAYINSKINISDISKFISLIRLPKFGVDQVEVEGRYRGHPLKFNSDVNLKYVNAIIGLGGTFDLKDGFVYDLKFNVLGLNPSDVLNRGDLSGSVSFSGILKGKGVRFETMEARANIDLEESVVSKVLIPKSNFWLEVKGGELNGSFVSLTEGLRGVIDLNLKKSREEKFLLSLSGSLTDLDLSQVRIDKPHFLKSHISGDFNARFSFGEVSAMELFAQLNPSIFGNYKISRLRLNVHYSGNREEKSLIVQSNMFDLNLDGKFNFADLGNSLTRMFNAVSQDVYNKLNFSESKGVDFSVIKNPVYLEYRIKFKNLTPISLFSLGRLFQATGNLNGVFLADSQGFYFYGSSELKQMRYINYEKGRVDTFKSDRFKGEIELSYKDQLRFKLRSELSDFTSDGFKIDKVGLSLNYDEPELYAEIFANGERWDFEAVSIVQFSREVNRLILKEFNGRVYGNKISIADEIEIFQSKSGVVINPSSFIFNDQKIYIGGFIDKQTQQLRMWGENLELDKLIKGKFFSGKVEFSFFIYGAHDKPNSNIEIFVRDLRYKNADLGVLECFGKIEDDLVKLNISLIVSAGEVNYNAMDVVLSSPAWFNPTIRSKYREPYVAGKVKLFRFPIAVLEPLLEGISDLKGDITAEIDLGGTFDKPSFKGNFSLQNCIFKFDPNGKYYLVYGVGKIDSNAIYVEDLNLWNNPDDYSGGDVRVNGKIYFGGGYSISKGDFNITGKLLVMDKEGFGTTGLYGRVIAQTGENGLSLKIDTTGFYLNGEIFLSDVDVNYFPKQSISARQGTGFEYVYVSPVDTVKEEIVAEELVHLNLPVKVNEIQNEGVKKQSIFSKFNYDLKIYTLNNAKINILLNTQTGEEFFAEFSGNLNLRSYSGLMVAHGVVDVLDRSYYNFFKRFNAKGKIKFVEDLKNPELDITATYTGTHTVLTDTLSSGKVENVLIELLISGTLSKPVVKIQMYIDGEDYQKVYPHGEVESDAISFLVTGRFKDELSRSEASLFTENLWSSTGAGLLSNVVSGVVTDVLRDVLGGVVTAAEFGYYSGFKGLRITGNIGGAVVQIGGDIFTDISKSVVIVQYPLFKKFLGGNLTIEYQRKPVQFYQEKEILNKLGLYYRIRL